MGVSRGSVPIVSSVHISSVHVSSVHISLDPSEPLMNTMFVQAASEPLLNIMFVHAPPKGAACSTRATAW